MTGRRIAIKGYELKDGKLVPCYKHLPVNLRLQSQRPHKRPSISRNQGRARE